MAKKLGVTEQVAENVRQRRKELGWTLSQLSDRLGELGHPLSVPVLSKMELGDRGIDVDDLVALAEVLDTNPLMLMRDGRIMAVEKVYDAFAAYLEAYHRRMATVALADHELELAQDNVVSVVTSDPKAHEAMQSLINEQFADADWLSDVLQAIEKAR